MLIMYFKPGLAYHSVIFASFFATIIIFFYFKFPSVGKVQAKVERTE